MQLIHWLIGICILRVVCCILSLFAACLHIGTIWMAKSSLIGNEGFGIFTTRDLKAGEKILGGPDGLSIPIVQYHTHKGQPNYKAHKAWIGVWDNYWWGRGVPDHVSYEEPTDIVDYQINFGALPNHHCILASLSTQYPIPPYDDSLVDRSSPAAGAFTYSRGMYTLSIFLKYVCRHKAFISIPHSLSSSLLFASVQDASLP